MHSTHFWGSMVSENPKFWVVLKGSRSQRELRTSQNLSNFYDLLSLGFQTHFLSCFFNKNSRRTSKIKFDDISILFDAIRKLYFKFIGCQQQLKLPRQKGYLCTTTQAARGRYPVGAKIRRSARWIHDSVTMRTHFLAGTLQSRETPLPKNSNRPCDW